MSDIAQDDYEKQITAEIVTTILMTSNHLLGDDTPPQTAEVVDACLKAAAMFSVAYSTRLQPQAIDECCDRFRSLVALAQSAVQPVQ